MTTASSPAATSSLLFVQIAPGTRLLIAAGFHRLADVPSAAEWFADISNPSTRRAYRAAVGDFTRFAGIGRSDEFRIVTRANAIAWRDTLVRRGLGGSTVRHRMASLASLFAYLRDSDAITNNPVKGVERPKAETAGGKTPAIGDHQARALLASSQTETVKSKRDRAILAMLLFHALRREELCKLKVRDVRHARKGGPHLRASGKGGKTRDLPLHPMPCGRRPPPTRSITKPTLPRCRSGSDTPTSLPRASTTIATPGGRTAPRSRLQTDVP